MLFAFLYAVFGLEHTGSDPATEISYHNFTEFLAAHPEGKFWGAWAFFRESLITAVYVMALQRELVYQPVHPWGRLLALLELVLSSTLIALFLLAVRRQFRR